MIRFILATFLLISLCACEGCPEPCSCNARSACDNACSNTCNNACGMDINGYSGIVY